MVFTGRRGNNIVEVLFRCKGLRRTHQGSNLKIADTQFPQPCQRERLIIVAKRIFLILFGIAFALLLLEIGLRVYAIILPGYSTGDQFSTFDPHLGWKNARGVGGIFRGKDFSARIRINELGLRGGAIQSKKPAAQAFRILLLGDSVTAGFEVEENETFAVRLEKSLNRCGHEGTRFEVINAGVRGYGTDQSLIYYEREGRKLGAALAIYTLVHNDLFENTKSSGLGGHYPKPRFFVKDGTAILEKDTLQPLQLGETGLLPSILRAVRYHSRALSWAGDIVQIALTTSGPPEHLKLYPEYRIDSPAGRPPAHRDLFRVLLRRLRESTQKAGTRVVFQIFPQRWELSRESFTKAFSGEDSKMAAFAPDRFHATYGNLARDLGIPVAGTIAAFRKADSGGGKLYVADGHLSAGGHAVISDNLARWLIREKIIPPRIPTPEHCPQPTP